MVVCMTRRNCVRLYDELRKLPQCPEIKVVMTGDLGQDPPEWSQAGHITTKLQRDAIKADKDRQRYQQDAETYRNDVLPRARGAAAKEVLDAEAYRLQVLALSQGQTARFDQVLAQYEHAPAVTRERMYLEAMENVYRNSRKVIVDAKNGNSMMYLPLDKLISLGPQSISMPNDTMTVPAARVPDVQVAPPEDPARARGVR